MDKTVKEQLEKLVAGLEEYQQEHHPRSQLDLQREILEFNHQGITQQATKKERLLVVRKGQLSEVETARRVETRQDYGDFRHDIEAGDPIQKHLKGDEEAIFIVRSEFLTKPKGPHRATKTIEIYE